MKKMILAAVPLLAACEDMPAGAGIGGGSTGGGGIRVPCQPDYLTARSQQQCHKVAADAATCTGHHHDSGGKLLGHGHSQGRGRGHEPTIRLAPTKSTTVSRRGKRGLAAPSVRSGDDSALPVYRSS